MTRENAKKLLPIIQAWADGKTIQLKDVDLDWKDITKCDVYFDRHPSEYRIKSEPKYRPFKNMEECWEEMQKHQPFGWIKMTNSNEFLNLISLGLNTEFEPYFIAYTFADGSPFGIKDE